MVERRTATIVGLLAVAVATIVVIGVGVARAAVGMVRLILNASSTRIPEGGSVTFTGRLTVDGEPIPNTPVDILSDESVIGTAVTDEAGNYSADVLFPASGTFTVKARAPIPQ